MAATLETARLVAIVGPTASGKSDLAMAAASRMAGEIVSCDSVQVYRGLDIGSGKPSTLDRTRVPHHLVDILDPNEEMNAAVFARRAAEAIAEISDRGRLPIVTGGTGLYLTALLKGLFEDRGADALVRKRLDGLAERFGATRLHRLLSAKDSAYGAKTKPSDRVRIVRALEVCFVTGKPFSLIQMERKPVFRGRALLIGLHPSRDELRGRVVARTRRMLSAGLVAETKHILSSSSPGRPRGLGAIGYREVVTRLAHGSLDFGGDDELQRAIVKSTMQYAKRQMTYFRNQFDVAWFAESEAALTHIQDWVRKGPGSPKWVEKGSAR
ncbi:MAG: tRNA (adenosine(37)-N6)-dimethylallyltransferase MiaA [Vicinamibacteria bacterium]|nr:tRNA (adenosine(37)-N6)-dimethylallyltransferase MiaA [Vicinamibacteria bacterium]